MLNQQDVVQVTCVLSRAVLRDTICVVLHSSMWLRGLLEEIRDALLAGTNCQHGRHACPGRSPPRSPSPQSADAAPGGDTREDGSGHAEQGIMAVGTQLLFSQWPGS
jgi:hypothetical protein